MFKHKLILIYHPDMIPMDDPRKNAFQKKVLFKDINFKCKSWVNYEHWWFGKTYNIFSHLYKHNKFKEL
jgi:hypothetical protein